MKAYAGAAQRGWKAMCWGSSAGKSSALTRPDLMQPRAVAHLMRQGKSFDEAREIIVKRADSVYKFSRPALYEGYRRCVADVRFADMPKDIMRGIEDGFLADTEKMLGYKAGRLERWLYRRTGMTF